MDWVQFALFFMGVFGVWMWSRAESRADMRHSDSKIDGLVKAIQDEMKDFHGRLCAIEERNKRG
jgi:hypothetical protein